MHDANTSGKFLCKLAERGADIFMFVERKWCCPIVNVPSVWLKAEDNIAILKIVPYADWLNAAGKKTRNMIRKAEKSGLKTQTIEMSDNSQRASGESTTRHQSDRVGRFHTTDGNWT